MQKAREEELTTFSLRNLPHLNLKWSLWVTRKRCITSASQGQFTRHDADQGLYADQPLILCLGVRETRL